MIYKVFIDFTTNDLELIAPSKLNVISLISTLICLRVGQNIKIDSLN